MDVSILRAEEKPFWDDFVLYSQAGMPFHLSSWQGIMEKIYHFPSWYLLAREAGQIVGVLPLFQLGSQLSSRVVTSLPGGICTENPAAAEALLARAQEIAKAAGARRLVIRDSRQPWGEESHWQQEHCAPVRHLPDSPELLKKDLSRQLRQHIRKAQEAGVQTVVGAQYLEEFYQVFAELLHEKGVPVFSCAFLRAVCEALPDHYTIVLARHEGRPVGAIFHFILDDRMFAVWGGAPARYRELRPSHALWWASMAYGIKRSCRFLDMGRSHQGSGAEEFKLRWGGKSEPVYQLTLPPGHRGFRGGVDSAGLLYRIFTATWRRLPLSVVQVLGPRLRRYIPFG